MARVRSIPIRAVRSDGSVRAIGEYLPDGRALALTDRGYPLLGPGEHRVDEDLPWVMQDIAPAGFIGARFSKWFADLALPARPVDWSADDTLRALTEAGHDLAGNLVVGEGSWERYQRVMMAPRKPGPDREEAEALFAEHIERARDETTAMSSLGGERPKFALRLSDGTGWLVKYSPPVRTLLGARWRDLLRMEMHCARTLADAGIPAAQGRVVESAGRACLVLERFDRRPARGRVGVTTWYWLAASQLGTVNAAHVPRVARWLADEGVLSPADFQRFSLAHAFSLAIGNDDAHLGNYALVYDDEGAPSLAPIYDVLPMRLAPRNDELPDDRARPAAESDEPRVRAMVTDLAERARNDPQISSEFRALWLTLARANDDRA